MAVKKLSNKIQSLFSSINILSYRRAAEELVYNALDAGSTSIAIRVNIEENKIQVVDSGNGIVKEDFKILGQRYATSKFVDISHFKSAPNSYGFRGQALASIMEVSKSVKITSRSNYTEETWTKTFYKGKEKDLSVTTTRPSKGTTIEVNGFLYNMKIQSKSIDQLNELNSIKVMLEQLSLVHNNVSFSLRDDTKNEIILQVHKSRDIYQTLNSLYNIGKADIQELQVEKGEYKAKAFIAKTCEHLNRHHLVFLNKKVVHNKKLHKVVQDGLKKYVHIARTKKFRSKNTDQDGEPNALKNQIPFYCIFASCPYYDYEISNTPRQTTLEFKDWNKINKLLEKVIKFYTGDLKVNEIKLDQKPKSGIEEVNQTREKVREIIKKYLGDSSKKPGISQMQKGIKGKIVKRKKEKRKEFSLSKVIPPKCDQNERSKLPTIINNNDINESPLAKQQSEPKIKQRKLNLPHQSRKIINDKLNKTSTTKLYSPLKSKIRKNPKHTSKDLKKKKKKYKVDALVKPFLNPSSTLIRKCNMLAREVENLLPFNKNMKNQRVFVNETVNYSTIVKNNQSYSVRNKVQETIVQNYVPLKHNDCNCKTQNYFNANFKTSHDLVKSVFEFHNIGNKSETKKEPNNQNLPQLTYQSHHYLSDSHYNRGINNGYSHINNDTEKLEYYNSKEANNVTSIVPIKEKPSKTQTFKWPRQTITHKNVNQYNSHFQEMGPKSRRKNTVFQKATFNFSSNITSYTIDFSDSRIIDYDFIGNDDCSVMNKNITSDVITIEQCSSNDIETRNIGLTYTLTETNLINENLRTNCTYAVHMGRFCDTTEDNAVQSVDQCFENTNVCSNQKEQQDPPNIIFVSNTEASPDRDKIYKPIQPLNICEVIMETSAHDKSIHSNTKKIDDSLLNFSSSEYFCTKNCERIENLAQQLMSTEIESTPSHVTERENNYMLAQKMKNNIPEVCNNTETNLNIDANNKIVENRNVINESDGMDNFRFKNRPRFLPKGMSQIFTTSNNRNAKTVISNIEYYEQEIYKRFMDDVQMQTEIYEPQIENQNEVATKAIDKVNTKLHKDTSSLTFSAQSLKEANVLGQVDRKFIATIMKGSTDTSDYLVLFDQHAVHERIRLEENLADYYDGETWKSVKLDDVTLKLSKDEIIYLHNYKDKFTQFGLHWTILNNHELTLHAIPEAILGKNPRQVEKVINAVKHFISEEVDIIKAQKGCAYHYPKAIMDLVNSEACRYAIMFGDSLTKKDCLELIRTLSSCKTPFQCAHGRPVMAVLMEIKSEIQNYKINMDKLRNFRVMLNTNKK